MVIEYLRFQAHEYGMRKFAPILAVVLTLPMAAHAQCYADYKAKQDSPLRLHYGVAQIRGSCDRGTAQSELKQRLASQGWTLLQVMSVFGPEGLGQRKDSAGRYYLRY